MTAVSLSYSVLSLPLGQRIVSLLLLFAHPTFFICITIFFSCCAYHFYVHLIHFPPIFVMIFIKLASTFFFAFPFRAVTSFSVL